MGDWLPRVSCICLTYGRTESADAILNTLKSHPLDLSEPSRSTPAPLDSDKPRFLAGRPVYCAGTQHDGVLGAPAPHRPPT